MPGLKQALRPEPSDLTKPLHVGDAIVVSATGRLRHVTVTKVTPTFVWVEYISPSTGQYHKTPFRRYFPGVNPPKEQS